MNNTYLLPGMCSDNICLPESLVFVKIVVYPISSGGLTSNLALSTSRSSEQPMTGKNLHFNTTLYVSFEN